ncbi:hypothetical protein IFR05_006237 [Cadophora sp. M221]|nr:hypothetical protein IFR05_006237 [Cadophora sp. M221]
MLMRLSMVATATLTTLNILPVLVASASIGTREIKPKISGCSYPVYIWQHDPICFKRGMNKKCSTEGGLAYTIVPGAQYPRGMLTAFFWESDLDWESVPRGLIISNANDATSPAMLFKYGLSYQAGSGHLRWSVTPGSAFVDENVKDTPSGPDAGKGDCLPVRCPKGNKEGACSDGIRSVDKPHMCESYSQNFWIDLCMPDGNF